MSKNNLDPIAKVVWTKQNCLEVVGQYNSKKEVEKHNPEAAKAIKANKWNYMYNRKYFGKNIPESTPQTQDIETLPVRESEQIYHSEAKTANTQEIQGNNLDLKAVNFKKGKAEVPLEPSKKTRRPKIYKLTKYQPLTFTLNVGRSNNLTVFDPEQQVTRAIRHCPNTKTIWLDEQNNDIAISEDITFINGFFETDITMGYTQDFLDIHPSKGKLFEEVNAEMDARELIEIEDLIIDIKAAIRTRMREEGGIENVRAIVSVLNADVVGAAKMTPSEIRFAAYECVDNNPKRFVNDHGTITIFDDPAIKRTAIAQHAFISGKIQVSPDGKQVLWADTKKPICAIPVGLNYLKVFSDFLNTEEGFNVAQEITKR